jgi:hypothetical protein
MRRWGTKLLLLAVVVTTIGCDQVSKHVASAHLTDGARQSGSQCPVQYSNISR